MIWIPSSDSNGVCNEFIHILTWQDNMAKMQCFFSFVDIQKMYKIILYEEEINAFPYPYPPKRQERN